MEHFLAYKYNLSSESLYSSSCVNVMETMLKAIASNVWNKNICGTFIVNHIVKQNKIINF